MEAGQERGGAVRVWFQVEGALQCEQLQGGTLRQGAVFDGRIHESSTSDCPSDQWGTLTASAAHSSWKRGEFSLAKYCTNCSKFLGPNVAEFIAIKIYQILAHYF